MRSERIKSRSNPLLKLARAAREGRERELMFVEGVRLCEEAARSPVGIEDVLYTERLLSDERGARLVEELSRRARRTVAVDEDVFASLSDTKTPQGIVALARRPPTEASVLESNVRETPLLVVMHGVGNPSNAGAMLRVAEAAGATGVISTTGSTDLFSPKALRGAMGSSFRLPVWTGASLREAAHWCAERSIPTVATDVRAGREHTALDWTEPRAVILGAEAAGLDETETSQADFQIKIPMRPPVESLNVAVALAVLLYEANRQRASRKAEG
ncbi:MAG TPA: RNA methyltransferase [Pyrinomonadaceae bacterium]